MRARTRAGRGSAERATDREIDVVAAVLAAGSEKAAAHRLGLSHSTVKRHLANARSKVGATTTAQLVWIVAPRLGHAEEQLGLGASTLIDGVHRGVNRQGEDPTNRPESRATVAAYDDRDVP